MSGEPNVRILRQIAELDGADAFKTKGKAPVMSEKAWAMLRPMADAGLIVLDESEAPIMDLDRFGHMLGRGFASLTEAGRAAIAAAEKEAAQ